MARTQNRNSILGLRNQANSIRDAENAPITPVRVGNLFNDIIDYLPLEDTESSSGSGVIIPTASGVTSITPLYSQGTEIARYVLNGTTGSIYSPTSLGGGLDRGAMWASLTNSDTNTTYNSYAINESHLGNVSKLFASPLNNPIGNYQWWGNKVKGSNGNLTVTGDLLGNIGKITFNKTINGTAYTAAIELEANNTLKVTGNLYATGAVSALGIQGEGSGSATTVELGNLLASIKNANLTVPSGSNDVNKGLIWGDKGSGTYGWIIGPIGGNGGNLVAGNWADWFNSKAAATTSTGGILRYNDGQVAWDNSIFDTIDALSDLIDDISASIPTTENFVSRTEYTLGLSTAVTDATNTYLRNLNLESLGLGINANTIAYYLNDSSKTPLPVLADEGGYLHYNATTSKFEWLLGPAITTILGASIDGTLGNSLDYILKYNSNTGKWETVNSYTLTVNGQTSTGPNLGTIYAPTSGGTSGLLLVSNGNAAPVWSSISNIFENVTVPKAELANKLAAEEKSIWGQNYVVNHEFLNISKDAVIKVGNIYLHRNVSGAIKCSNTFIEDTGNIIYNSAQQEDLGNKAFGIYNSRISNIKVSGGTPTLDTGSFIMRFEENGLVNLPYRPPIADTTNYSDTYRGLRIGNGVLTWEQSTNSFKVYACNSNGEVTGPANFYATGGVSALGIPNTGSGSLQNATITNLNSDTLKIGSYTIKKEETTTQSASATTHNKDLIIEADSDLTGVEAGSTTTLGKIVFLFPNVNNPLTISKNGVTSPIFYFDDTHYLYINNSGDLIYHKGNSGDKNITLNL